MNQRPIHLHLYILLVGLGLVALPAAADSARNTLALSKARQRLGRSVYKNFRVKQVEILDQGLGGAAGNQIDILQNVCEDAQDETEQDVLEPFYEPIVRFEVENNLDVSVRLKKFWFRTSFPEAGQRKRRSRKIAFTGNRLIAREETGDVIALMLDISGGQKYINGQTAPLSIAGFRNFTFIMRARTSTRKRIIRKVKTTLSLDDVDRCES